MRISIFTKTINHKNPALPQDNGAKSDQQDEVHSVVEDNIDDSTKSCLVHLACSYIMIMSLYVVQKVICLSSA